VDKSERLMVLDGGHGGGHVGHQVNGVLVTGPGDVDQVPRPAGRGMLETCGCAGKGVYLPG
jgi:hypothetical protein